MEKGNANGVHKVREGYAVMLCKEINKWWQTLRCSVEQATGEYFWSKMVKPNP